MNFEALRSVFDASIRVDAVTLVMLLLVGSLAVVIVRFSRTYLQGEVGTSRYFRWLFLTLGAIVCLVVSKNLLVIATAWVAASLALHQLLTFYRDRTAALVAAHKKFLVSRLADACLLGCLVLVHREVGSFDLDRIDEWSQMNPNLTPPMHAAAVLVVLAVVLRSAQLPFHGWLIQVMEAPTPVSALLHAGIVNIGGFVMIRLGPWMAHATPARMLLLGFGLVTAAVAALVVTTRVSVKVALAWSTCAQMGFMLVECALGAFDLALLHLVAHSLYKAHAFLGAGATVEQWRDRDVAPPHRTGWGALLVGVGAMGMGSMVGALTGHISLGVVVLLLGLTTGPALLQRGGWSSALAIAVLSVCGHWAAAHVVSDTAYDTSRFAGWALTAATFLVLFAIKSLLELRPHGSMTRALYPWLFAGFYLDDVFTHRAFRIWPPRLGRGDKRPTSSVAAAPSAVEA